MDVAADPPPASPDFRRWDFASPSQGTKSVPKKESYVDALARASLRMVSKGLPVEVQCHGVRMLLHLLCFRKEDLSSTTLADLRKVLVGSLDDLVLKDATTLSDDPMGSTANLKAKTKHRRCLLVVLAALETNTVIGKVTGGEGNLSSISNISNNSGRSSDRSSGIWNETYCSSLSEDYDYVRFMTYRDSSGDTVNIINACKEFVEVADPAMLANDELMSSHQGKGSLLLVEHNIICQAFLILISYSGIHQYEEILPCLLRLLNKIWTLEDWISKYLHHGSALTCLFSDGQFLKMVYYLVRFCEVELKRSRTEVFTAVKSCELYIVTLLPLILPLLLELLKCIHGLWCPSIAGNLSEVLERAKYPDPSFLIERTTKLVCIKDEEGSQEKETRALIEGIRESGYNVIGLCASIEGAFSWLLNSSVSGALLKYFWAQEFRHLGKIIKLTVIPVVKNCPRKSWKEWVDNWLQHLLRHCEKILHYAWFSLLYHGPSGAPYYFGNLSGLEGNIKALERDILLEFTREISRLLEVVALTEQNRTLSLLDVTQDNKTISFQDIDSMPSTSLFRYLIINDCFGKLRMGLFGYFVDDTATAKAIPFCRALVCLAVGSNDGRFRIFIVDNLLPCLIQRLDNKLPCAIQRLKCELNSSASINASSDKLSSSATDNASRGLVVLCQELYVCMLNSGYVQTQALGWGDENGDNTEHSFEVWLGRQKKDFRAKAYSAAAKEFPFGDPWIWELEDECHRYLSDYIDMLQEVEATDDFAKDIYLDKESLFQKLRPEFRSKYAMKTCSHPYMMTISSAQHRRYYSTDDVVRGKEICNVLCKLIKLKPYIKGSDRSWDVLYRLKRTSKIPRALSEYVAPSVELLLHSVLFFWEPRFHPMIREANMDKLLNVADGLMASAKCLEPVVPIIGDFPLHLQPYAQALVENKLKESKYYIAKEQISVHEEFDEFLASGELDDYMDQFMSSKDDFMEELVVNKLLPSQFLVLDCFLIKLSFERRAEIVHMHTEICTYDKCLRGLFASEPLKVKAQSLISELEAEGFFDVDSNRINWGKTSFSERVDKFSSEFFPRNSLPKHYAIRGLIDCRTILLQKDISQQEALEKVVVDVCNSLTGYLRKFWKDTRYYEHQYYHIIRDPLRIRQVNSGPRTQPF